VPASYGTGAACRPAYAGECGRRPGYLRRAEFLLPPTAPCPDHAGALFARRLTLELDPGITGVGGAHGAETVEDSGEELKEELELVEVLEHAGNVEAQLVHAIGELRPEPALVVHHLEANARLGRDQVAQLRVHEERAQPALIATLDVTQNPKVGPPES